MRTSLLSRSVIAVATLGIGSAALAVTPATAATASGVTRDQVLTVVNGIRAAEASNDYIVPADVSRALRALVYKTCDIVSDEDEGAEIRDVQPLTAGDDAQGVLVTARVYRNFSNTADCTFVAVATSDTSSALSGTATVKGTRNLFDEATDSYVPTPVTQTTALSGDAYTSPVIITPSYNNDYLYDTSAAAAGNATKTTEVAVSKHVKDKKTKSEKKKAKAKYEKKIKSIKKSYAKALDKAGKSKSKKAAAKKAYKAKRAAAKAAYKYAIAGYKIVKSTNKVVDVRPFSIATPVEPEEQMDVQSLL